MLIIRLWDARGNNSGADRSVSKREGVGGAPLFFFGIILLKKNKERELKTDLATIYIG